MAPFTTPRYRYREESPEIIAVPARELFDRLPEELRGEQGGGALEGRLINLPCAEILRGNVPRITLGRLGELASGLVRVPENHDPGELLNLPPGWIALHFQMMTKREVLPSEQLRETPSEPSIVGAGEKASAPVVVELNAPPRPESPLVKPINPEAIRKHLSLEAKTKEEPNNGPSETVLVPKKRFFTSWPIFRKNAPVDLPVTELPITVAEAQPVSMATTEVAPPPPPVLERLWKLDPQDELADCSALQALFMTDEKLTLENVVAKAGELPGLDACVLAHGDRVICASKAPSGTDLQTLSSQAMTMLCQIRDSSEKMGLGTVPAITLHADRGVVSFLLKGELCLLVLHADRGFSAGVRERLQEMLAHLADAIPALPPPPPGQVVTPRLSPAPALELRLP